MWVVAGVMTRGGPELGRYLGVNSEAWMEATLDHLNTVVKVVISVSSRLVSWKPHTKLPATRHASGS